MLRGDKTFVGRKKLVGVSRRTQFVNRLKNEMIIKKAGHFILASVLTLSLQNGIFLVNDLPWQEMYLLPSVSKLENFRIHCFI